MGGFENLSIFVWQLPGHPLTFGTQKRNQNETNAHARMITHAPASDDISVAGAFSYIASINATDD